MRTCLFVVRMSVHCLYAYSRSLCLFADCLHSLYTENLCIHILTESRQRRQVGFQRLNQLSFMQIISSCPLFIAGVVTLVMALPHVEYPVFNFGPVIVAILVGIRLCVTRSYVTCSDRPGNRRRFLLIAGLSQF